MELRQSLRRDRSLHVSFLGELELEESLSGGHHVLVLDTHDTTSPGSSDVDVLNVVLGELVAELLNLDHVLSVDLSESNTGGGLEVNKLSEGSLSAEEAEWSSLASAESWEMDHELNWVNIVGNHNKLGLSFFDKSGDVVETEFEVLWLWRVVSVLAGLQSLSLLLESVFLFFLVFWGVFGEKFEEFSSY